MPLPVSGSLNIGSTHTFLIYTLGFCVRRGGRKPEWREPLQLRLGDGRRFRLDFRCDECQMNIVAEGTENAVK